MPRLQGPALVGTCYHPGLEGLGRKCVAGSDESRNPRGDHRMGAAVLKATALARTKAAEQGGSRAKMPSQPLTSCQGPMDQV